MRERKLQIVIKRGRIYARTTYVGLDGKRHAVWRAGRNRTDAKDNLRKALDDLQKDEGALVNAKRTFAELADWYSSRYLVPAEYRDGRIVRGKRSYLSEQYLLRAITRYFGGYRLRAISHGELEKYKEHRLTTPIISRKKQGKTIITSKRPRTIASVNRELMVIRAMLRKAQKEGWLLRVPFEEHDSLIRMSDERRRERILSYAEETMLLAACTGPRGHLRPIVICALDTGMRKGEILKLRWSDIDFGKLILHVRSTNTKQLESRNVPITELLLRELCRLRDLADNETEFVFGIANNVRRSFASACKIAGIKHGGIEGLTFHCLRHTAATRMVKQGMDLAEIARILGHAQIKTTFRYVSADPDIVDKARGALAFRPSVQSDDQKHPGARD